MSYIISALSVLDISTLSLHDALPISVRRRFRPLRRAAVLRRAHRQPVRALQRRRATGCTSGRVDRSEEHMSELQSRPHLVCRLLLEKKKITTSTVYIRQVHLHYTILL